MRGSFVRLFLGLVASLLLAACAAPAPTATPTKAPAAAPTATKAPPTPTPVPVKLTVVQSTLSLAYGGGYPARARYLKEEGIDAEYVIPGSGAKALAALVGGSGQFLTGAPSDALNAIVQGQPIVILASIYTEVAIGLAMHKDVAQRLGITYQSSEEAKVKALKGLKIGITSPGSLTDQAVRYLSKKYNLDPDRDMEIVSVGSEGLVAALAAKQIDTLTMSSPLPDTSVAKGDAIWLFKMGDLKEYSPFMSIALMARRDYVEKNADVTKRVIRAYIKGAKLIKENPNEAKTITRSFFQELDPAVFEEAWKTNLPAYGDPAVSKAGFDAIIRWQKALGQSIAVTYEQAVIPTFVEDAKKEVGYK